MKKHPFANQLRLRYWYLIREKEVIREKPKHPEIEELITQLKNIEITPPKERPTIVRKSQKWTFFQVEEQQSKKDHE